MGAMESANPKFAPSHSKIEITKTQMYVFSLPEVSTEAVALYTFERKTGKTGNIFMFLTQSNKVLKKLLVFIAFLAHFFAQNLN